MPEQVIPKCIGTPGPIAYVLVAKFVDALPFYRQAPDNNMAENTIRPFVIDRKNWLFSVIPEGAAASAAIYSLIETAKANGLEPYWYFRYLLEKLPDAMTEDDYKALLPQYLDKTKLAGPPHIA